MFPSSFHDYTQINVFHYMLLKAILKALKRDDPELHEALLSGRAVLGNAVRVTRVDP
jgi:hypothetical protein